MSGRVVVVTGASAGIGRATAVAFGRRGEKVALLARGEKGLAAAAEDVRAAGGTPLVIGVDVSDADAVEAAADRVETELGPIDVWCNVAFTTAFARFEEISAEEWTRATAVTYFGFANDTRAALKRMKQRDRGVIVQTGSALGYRGIPLQSVYCGAKHAIKGFTESVHTELMHQGSGVHITMVNAPGVNTPQFSWVLNRLPKRPQPVAPIYQPEVLGEAMAYASEHPRRRAWWVGIPTVYTILGEKVSPVPRLVPRPQRGQGPADRPGRPAERSGQPVGAGRWTRRPGLRGPGPVQRPGVDPGPTDLGQPAPRHGGRRGCCRRGRCRGILAQEVSDDRARRRATTRAASALAGLAAARRAPAR